jgi:hypothetical protein
LGVGVDADGNSQNDLIDVELQSYFFKVLDQSGRPHSLHVTSKSQVNMPAMSFVIQEACLSFVIQEGSSSGISLPPQRRQNLRFDPRKAAGSPENSISSVWAAGAVFLDAALGFGAFFFISI